MLFDIIFIHCAGAVALSGGWGALPRREPLRCHHTALVAMAVSIESDGAPEEMRNMRNESKKMRHGTEPKR